MSIDITQEAIKKFLALGEAGLVSRVLWHGQQPCSMCKGTMHSKYEPNAFAWVCAGCYNDFALEKGWEKE
jgi:hypothetical protein